MSRDFVILCNGALRARAIEKIRAAPEGTHVEFRGPKRSVIQNALLWSRLGAISEHVEWYGQHLTPEDWKDVLTASLRRTRVVPGIEQGSFVPLGMRTSQMSKAEFSDLLELVGAFGAERGVVFPEDTPKAWRRGDDERAA